MGLFFSVSVVKVFKSVVITVVTVVITIITTILVEDFVPIVECSDPVSLLPNLIVKLEQDFLKLDLIFIALTPVLP